MNEGLTGDEKIWEKIITSKQFAVDPFKRCKGDQVNIDLIRREGLDEPIIFPDPTGLDMAMPRHAITVRDIANLVGKSVVICAARLACVLSLSFLFLKSTGGDTPVDVIGKEGQPHGCVVLLFGWWTHA